MIHTGIDLHSTNMVNVAMNDNAEVVRQAKLPACRRSLEEFFCGFSEPLQAVVECTSNWYWLSDWFREHDIPLKLAHAKMVKAISYAKVKTDKLDAKTLAGLLRVGLIPGSKDSGGSRRHRSGCKDGNKYLRLAFGDAAVAGHTHYPGVKKFYQKIKRRSGKNIARAVVAKELAKITWHVLSKGEPYKGFSRRDPYGKGAAHPGCLSSLLASAYKPARITGISSPCVLIGE